MGSAKGKTTTKKKTAPAKRNTGAVKNRQGNQKNQKKDFASFHAEVAVWTAIAVAVLLLLGNFNLCGEFGDKLSSVFFGAFGFSQYFIPIAIVLLTGLLIANHFSTLSVKKTLLVILLLSLCSAVSQMFVDFNCSTVADAMNYSFYHHTGGGVIGGGICIFLHRAFGKAGAVFIVLFLTMLSLMLIFERSVLQFLHDAGIVTIRASKTMGRRYQQGRKEKELERRQRREEREENRETEQKGRLGLGELVVREEKTNTVPKKRRQKKWVDLGDRFGLDTDFEEYKGPHSEGRPEPEDFFEEAGKPVIMPFMEKKTESFEMPEGSGSEKKNPQRDNKTGMGEQKTEQSPENRKAETAANAGQRSTDPGTGERKGTENGTQTEEYVFPPLSLLTSGENTTSAKQQKTLRSTAAKLQQTLANFGVSVTITDVSCGPSVTRYELQPEVGVKVSKIVGLADDIKLNLAAADIRIEAPIPGKAAVGIEVPNKHKELVRFKDLIDNDTFRNFPSNLAIAVGKDIAGHTVISDIAKMPHLLIAGATGAGKSVCINVLIMSILYKASPKDVKFIMIDPKVVELSIYNGIPHLLIPVVTDPQKAAGALNWAVAEMTDRYNKFAALNNAKNIKEYNRKVEDLRSQGKDPEGQYEKMPQIVIIVDELSDLMMAAPGEVENAIVRLSQMARAAGIHLIIATQRPSVNVITGLIKANVPSRIAFAVSSGIDSRTIIDMNGAEKLLGNGDMLFHPQGKQKPVRAQGALVSDEEVERVVEFLKEHSEAEEDRKTEEVEQKIEKTLRNTQSAGDRDAYFEEAARFIMTKDKASIGMIQRMFKVGFNRASRIMDQLEEAGVVGPEEGTKPRKIIMSEEQFEQYLEDYL